jgi:hypothetical protein
MHKYLNLYFDFDKIDNFIQINLILPKMKNILIALVMILISAKTNGQTGILFVNDNEEIPGNTTTVLSAFDDTGYIYDVFDAVAEQRSPDFSELLPYQLVIWYTGTDGVDRWLWNGENEDNVNLMAWLNEGGYFWVMGNDFLVDRYGTPTTFQEGEFVYDYLGIETYFAQSYGDDGGIGVSQLDLVQGQSITSLDPVQWSFPTLWWADACLPVEGGQPVYRMGPESYVFNDYYTAIFYEAPTHKALSFCFDPSLMDTDQNRIQLFSDVMAFFENLVGVDEKDTDILTDQLKMYPNPVVSGSPVKIFHKPENLHSQKVSVFDAMGNEIVSTGVSQNGDEIIIQTNNLKPGVYIVKCGEVSGRFVIIDG